METKTKKPKEHNLLKLLPAAKGYIGPSVGASLMILLEGILEIIDRKSVV